MKKSFLGIIVLICFQLVGCSDSDGQYVALTPEEGEEFSGGGATFFNTSAEAFGFSAVELTADEQTAFGVGNSLFRQSWVSAPASTTARDGLGPFFNAIACASCHFKDGRGRPPMFDGELGQGLLLKLTLSGTDAHGFSLPDPIYGGQLQDNSILGQTVKGKYHISYQIINETLADGTVVSLQKPIYNLVELGYGPISSGIKISPRIANQIVGLGLLEAIPQAAILAYADENDSDGDGISGKANYVYNLETNTTQMGRFGWKANQPNIRQQVAAAFSNDMGITSSIFPNENCPPGVDCNSIPNGGSPEITNVNFDRVVLYSQTLSVPGRRNYKEQNVLRGKKIFEQIQCNSCHVQKFQTGSDHPIAALRNQTIRPYTDMLLHDMGDALSDNAPDFLASGNEWRTQPLWGIGLINTINKHTNLLHDGRARNVTEAILWHGGEGENSKNKFKQLSTAERNDLLDFINSL